MPLRNVLRPQLFALEDLRQRLFADKGSEALDSAYTQWLQSFTHTDKQVALAQSIREFVHHQAAVWFGVQNDELDVVLMAAEERKLSARELQQNLDQYRNAEYTDQAFGDDSANNATDTEDGPVFDPGAHKVPNELAGIQVAHGHTLTPVSPADTVEDGADTSHPSSAPDGQMELDGLSDSPESSLQALHDGILNLTEVAGITSCLRDAPGMPLGFFMDIPEAPLGGSVFDLPVRAWWFLVNVCGQLILEYFELQVQSEDHDALVYALYDTGEQGFIQLIGNEQAWTGIIESHLGGMHMAEGHYIADLLTDEHHPLCEAANQVIQAARAYRRCTEVQA